MPLILKVTQSNATTDINGLASVVPSSSGFSPPLEVDVTVTAGVSAWLDYPLQVFAPLAIRDSPKRSEPTATKRLPVSNGDVLGAAKKNVTRIRSMLE